MNYFSMYKFFKGEKENPFDATKQGTAHFFWFYESVFDRDFTNNDSSDWYAFFGGENSTTAPKFMKLLSEEDYKHPTEKKKAAIFDIWLNSYLFVDKLYGEYGSENEYKKMYYSITAQ